MVNKFVIDTYVENLANISSVKSFTPNLISNALNIPLQIVIERLNNLVEDQKLIIKYDIRCDNADVIDIVDDYSVLIGKNSFCKICDDDFEISLENVFPVYYFEPEYRDYLKKKIVTVPARNLKMSHQRQGLVSMNY